jgi:hypothetical protein
MAEPQELRAQWEADLKKLTAEKSIIEAKILGLQTMIKGLDYMEGIKVTNFKLDPLPLPPGLENLHSMGLTDAIRAVVTEAMEPLAPKQVRDRLLAYDYKRLPTDNPMAAIHGVLRRLDLTGALKMEKVGKKNTFRASSLAGQTTADVAESTRQVRRAKMKAFLEDGKTRPHQD